jgi:hypothetical protein
MDIDKLQEVLNQLAASQAQVAEGMQNLAQGQKDLLAATRAQTMAVARGQKATEGASKALGNFDDDLEESARSWLAMTKEQREAHVRQKEAQSKGVSALQSLGDAGMAAGRAMLEGKKGATAMNDSLGHLAQAATLAGTALMLLVPGGPLIKGLIAGFTAITAGVTKYAQAANEMADKLYTGYAGMAKAGGAAADGMTGLFEDTKKLGLSMNELGDFVNVVTKNAPELAMFGGTVFEGRKRLAAMGKELESNREAFINMGLSMQDVTEGMAGYIRLQTRVGQTQNKTTQELAAGAKRYLEEQDLLTKLTGMSRQEQEAAREAALSEQRFAGKLQQLRDQGRHDEAEELMKVNIMLMSQSKEAAQAFRDISTNNVQTEAAQKGLRSSQGEMMRTAQLVSAGQIKAAEATGNIVQAVGRTTKALGPTMAMMGTHEDSFLSYSDSVKMAGQQNRDYVKESEEAAAQIKRQKEGADPLVKQQGELRKTQIDANEAMERFVKAGIGPAQDAMIMLAKATLRGTDALNRMFGITESEESKNKKAENEQRAKDLNVDLTNKNKEIETLQNNIDKAKKSGNEAEVKKLQDQVKRAEADKFAIERGKRTAESGVMGSSTWEGFEQRAGGSLDAAGKLIENFGKGTPAMLHGREGVITEDQLKQFGAMAMKVGMGSQASPSQAINVDVKLDRAEPPDTNIDRQAVPTAMTEFDTKISRITDVISKINQRSVVGTEPQGQRTAAPIPDTKLTPDSLQKWVDGALSQTDSIDNQSLQKYVDSALNKDAEVSAGGLQRWVDNALGQEAKLSDQSLQKYVDSALNQEAKLTPNTLQKYVDSALDKDAEISATGLQRWVDSALDKDAEINAGGLQRWVDSAFSDIKLDVTPFRQSIEAAAEEITRAPVNEINEQVTKLMQDTKDLVQWQQTYSTTERETQEDTLELTKKIRDNTFQSRLITDRDRLNLDNFADRRRQLYDNIVENLDQQFKVTRVPAGASNAAGTTVPTPAAGSGAATPSDAAGSAAATKSGAAMPSDADIQAGIGGNVPQVKGIPTGSGAPPDIDARDFVKFTGGTGSKQHFEKLADNVESSFLQMARDYNQLTGGKTLQVNSAFRSPEEQANVDSGTNPKAAPGMSLHNVGRALDIQSAQRNELDQLGLLKKYGFRPLQGDPPHISMRDGGIARGPESGYPAELHGTEAVIPLGDGALTMDLPAIDSLLEVTTDMGEQITALKDDMRAMLTNLNETMRQNTAADGQSRMIEILENINRAQNQTADSSRKIAQASMN